MPCKIVPGGQVEVLYELAANAAERSQGIDKFGPLSALEALK